MQLKLGVEYRLSVERTTFGFKNKFLTRNGWASGD